MKAPWSGQLSAAKTGWLVMLLFFGWLAYLLVPVPKPEPEPTPPPVKRPPSRLVTLGLPDNPDLEHLPEYFALYADQADWENDKTIFAYWSPGSDSYSYYLEAKKVNEKFSYRLISKSEAYKTMTDEGYPLDDPDGNAINETATTATPSVSRSSTHPMVLFHSSSLPPLVPYKPSVRIPVIPPPPSTVPINFNVPPQPLPKMGIKSSSVLDAPTKK